MAQAPTLQSYQIMQQALQTGSPGIQAETLVKQAVEDLQAQSQEVFDTGTKVQELQQKQQQQDQDMVAAMRMIGDNDKDMKVKLDQNDAILKSAVDQIMGVMEKTTAENRQAMQEMEARTNDMKDKMEQEHAKLQAVVDEVRQQQQGAQAQGVQLAQFQQEYGTISKWATSVNSQFETIGKAVESLRTGSAPGGISLGPQSRGILESKAWTGLKVLDPDKMMLKEWLTTLKQQLSPATTRTEGSDNMGKG